MDILTLDQIVKMIGEKELQLYQQKLHIQHLEQKLTALDETMLRIYEKYGQPSNEDGK